MVNRTRYTLPREVEMVRIVPSMDEAEGDRLELRRAEPGYTVSLLTRRAGVQQRGAGDDLTRAFDDLAKALPAAAQRTSRAGSTIALSRLRQLERALVTGEARITLQRSPSLHGPWKAELFEASKPITRGYGSSICDALIALSEAATLETVHLATLPKHEAP